MDPITWVYIAVVVVSAYLSQRAANRAIDKAAAKPEKASIPDVKDGKRLIRVFGTVWIDDPTQLAMLQTGQDPIKSKGGKK